MSTTIYILKLVDDCYYVGKTTNIEERYFQHTSGKGSLWTKIHRPIKIEKLIDNCDIFDEDKYVKKYMAMFGIDKVRGGSYVKEHLDEEQIKTIQKEINASMDLCVNCGQADHFIKDCKVNKQTINKVINVSNSEIKMFACQYCDKDFATQNGATYHENFYCKEKVIAFACQYCNKDFETQNGATYHENFYCKEKIIAFACKYCNKEFETQKGATFHENVHCPKKNNKSKGNKCFTCGREGHYSEDCYATKHVKGYEIN